MEYREYKKLYDSLNFVEDIDALEKKGYDHRLLKTLYTQKSGRDVKRRFYIVKKDAPIMLKKWKRGMTMTEIARKWRFPPILAAMMIFLEDGASKKEFWSYIADPDQLCEQTADELREVVAKDPVYSPEGNEEQRQRGIWGEGLLHEWLDGQGVTYRTENDIRGEYEKTPDALLDRPMMFEGHKIYWVESKASFGDNTEFRYNSRKQLIPYTKIFGPGVVVYWVGRLDDLEAPEGIYVEDISVMGKKLEECGE